MHITPSLPETAEDFAADALLNHYAELINGGNAPGSRRLKSEFRGSLYAHSWPDTAVPGSDPGWQAEDWTDR